MQGDAPKLSGRYVNIIPLSSEHAEALWRVSEPGLFAYSFLKPQGTALDQFETYIQRILEAPRRQTFVIVVRETGEPVGMTSYLDMRPAHRALEIGATWIAAVHQGTQVNPESKLLLLSYAFEAWGALRVQFKADARNLHSRRAILKLGATEEGTLRKHDILPDGYVRDAVIFSITDEEWPGVKRGLEARLVEG